MAKNGLVLNRSIPRVPMRRRKIKRERFVAYREGKKIATAKTLEELLSMKRVKGCLGSKEFLIRHIAQDKVELIYQGGRGFLGEIDK